MIVRWHFWKIWTHELNIITFYVMYGYGSLKQRITCLFNWFRSYNKIASKGCAGGLNRHWIVFVYLGNILVNFSRFFVVTNLVIRYQHKKPRLWRPGDKTWIPHCTTLWNNTLNSTSIRIHLKAQIRSKRSAESCKTSCDVHLYKTVRASTVCKFKKFPPGNFLNLHTVDALSVL